MTTSGGGRGGEFSRGAGELSRQLASETKPSVFTTEFWAYVAVAIAVLIAGLVSDTLDATQVWLYVTVLTGDALRRQAHTRRERAMTVMLNGIRVLDLTVFQVGPF